MAACPGIIYPCGEPDVETPWWWLTMRRPGHATTVEVSYGSRASAVMDGASVLVVDDNYRALRLRATGALLRVMA